LLVSDKTTIEKRVLEESRKQFGKANNLEILHKIWKNYDLFSPVPERESLIIDNTNLSAVRAAKLIIEHFNI
jgi:RNase adaptor protein for sRNA GlmZ degradation